MYRAYREPIALITARVEYWAYRKCTDHNQSCALPLGIQEIYWLQSELCTGQTGNITLTTIRSCVLGTQGASYWPQYELCTGQIRSIILTTIWVVCWAHREHHTDQNMSCVLGKQEASYWPQSVLAVDPVLAVVWLAPHAVQATLSTVDL